MSELNEKIEAWARGKTSEMLNNISSMDIVASGNLFKKLRYKLDYHFGDVDRISWKMPRYGVIQEKGEYNKRFGNREVFVRISKGKREWFSSVINESSIKTLSDIIAKEKGEEIADRMVDNIKIRK